MNKTFPYERYQRQMMLPGFGIAAQQQLSEARVLVIGAGGLGCPALQYLTGAGVGVIGIADGDTVSLSNLHRQILFQTNDIGKNKAETAAFYLRALNPEIDIQVFPKILTSSNLLEVLADFDIVLDGSDNFATRYMINDACVLMNKVLVYGAVSRFEGQVAVFNYMLENGERSSNYRDLFPQPPQETEVLNCADAGVVGVLPGIIGSMQANEVIKLLTGLGTPLVNQLLTFNAMSNQFYTVNILPVKHTHELIPKDIAAFEQTDYNWLCNALPVTNEIDATTFEDWLGLDDMAIVDVRELHELPAVNEFEHYRIPLTKLLTDYQVLTQQKIVVFCQSGKRSRQAVSQLAQVLDKSKTIVSLRGGILAWKQFREWK
ncbi:MAG: molybdopterin-synthase adenylyltransferase MoeB [Sediminibacterium sp.]